MVGTCEVSTAGNVSWSLVMHTTPSKASDLVSAAPLAAAIALIWVLFTTDTLIQWTPWPIRQVTWWDMVRVFGG